MFTARERWPLAGAASAAGISLPLASQKRNDPSGLFRSSTKYISSVSSSCVLFAVHIISDNNISSSALSPPRLTLNCCPLVLVGAGILCRVITDPSVLCNFDLPSMISWAFLGVSLFCFISVSNVRITFCDTLATSLESALSLMENNPSGAHSDSRCECLVTRSGSFSIATLSFRSGTDPNMAALTISTSFRVPWGLYIICLSRQFSKAFSPARCDIPSTVEIPCGSGITRYEISNFNCPTHVSSTRHEFMWCMELFPNRIALGLQGVGFTSSVAANAASMKFVSAPESARLFTRWPSTIDQIVKWVVEWLVSSALQNVVSLKPHCSQSQVCVIDWSDNFICFVIDSEWRAQNWSNASLQCTLHMLHKLWVGAGGCWRVLEGALSPWDTIVEFLNTGFILQYERSTKVSSAISYSDFFLSWWVPAVCQVRPQVTHTGTG